MRYNLTFDFTDTEAQAKALCDRLNARATRYIRANKPAHYTPWEARDKQGNVVEAKYIVWHYA